MFTIVEDTPRTIWCPIADSEVIYVGQIVGNQANEGIAPLGTGTGAADTTGKVIPFGIVVGTNSSTSNYDATYQTEKITDITPHDSTTSYVGQEGVWSKGGRVAMALVELIDPTTVIKGDLNNAAVGTAPTLLTVTTGGATGVSCTTGATDVAGVAVLSTIYFRTGANAGEYRITDDTSTTALTWDKPTYADVAIGDTAVRVNIRAQGLATCQFDSESIYVDIGATTTTNNYSINVIKLDLSTANKEHVYFTFNADHFAGARA